VNDISTEQVRWIAPVSDAEAARRVSAETLADLAVQITGTPVVRSGRATDRRRVAWRSAGSRRRRLVLGLPLAAMGVAVAVVVSLLVTGNQALPPAAYQALSFTTSSGYITVLVKNPYADPSWYNADFASHHLAITLRVVPVSPSLVGTVVFEDDQPGTSDITPITAKGKCWTGGGGDECTIGVKVPLDFHGQASVDFGRPARSGEQYASTTSPFVAGEALYGMHYIIGQTVPTVLAELAKRHLTAVLNNHVITTASPSQFPGTWYVQDAVPYAPGVVMLFINQHP
jgi:hypothetical protein